MTDFAAIDFETANRHRASVCSVGAVVVRGGEVVDSFYSLIRPRPNYYSPFTTAIHGLCCADTDEAPEFEEVWRAWRPASRAAAGGAQRPFRRGVPAGGAGPLRPAVAGL